MVQKKILDLGSYAFTEEDIFDYAKVNDPLPFHLSREAAAKSIFGKLVSSGGQAFNYFYVNRWVPIMGESVLAGMGIDRWTFHEPIGVDEEINCTATIESVKQSKSYPERLIVLWHFKFHNTEDTLVQDLLLTVLHQQKLFYELLPD
jgi:acyl dehydratase